MIKMENDNLKYNVVMEPVIVNFIKLELIDNSKNIRKKVSNKSITLLANNIKEHGLLQPIAVQIADNVGKYQVEVVFGHRRYLAYQELYKKNEVKYSKIPCILVDYHGVKFNDVAKEEVKEEDANRMKLQMVQFSENMLREGMTEEEKAKVVFETLNILKTEETSMAKLASKFGVSKSYIQKLNGIGKEIYDEERKMKEAKAEGKEYIKIRVMPKYIESKEIREFITKTTKLLSDLNKFNELGKEKKNEVRENVNNFNRDIISLKEFIKQEKKKINEDEDIKALDAEKEKMNKEKKEVEKADKAKKNKEFEIKSKKIKYANNIKDLKYKKIEFNNLIEKILLEKQSDLTKKQLIDLKEEIINIDKKLSISKSNLLKLAK